MNLLETIKVILTNPKLMAQYNYSKEDIENLDLSLQNQNEFVQMVSDAVRLMNYEEETPRITTDKLFKSLS